MVKRTQLYDTHVAMGARMVPFAGYEMPVQYGSPIEEHHTVRRAAGLFDIDHMGQFIVAGPDRTAFLQRMVTSDVTALAVGEAGYSLLTYADGGTVDDVFLYHEPDHWFVVVNASNREKDFAWLQAHAAGFNITLTDISEETYMLAFQGPQAQAILQRITDTDLGKIAFHHSGRGKVAGVEAFIGNTGYTGEYGFELFFDAARAVQVWNAILEAGRPEGAAAIGLAARDSLRFEPCLPLYGHELSPGISPLESGLTFAVQLDVDFVGREALLKQKLEGPPRRLVCLEMVDKGVPREGCPVLVDGQQGFVTTGMKAPTPDIFAAMALIPRETYAMGKQVEVLIHDKPRLAQIVKRPFYTPAYRR